MYFLDQRIKTDPVRRWNLPDRIFFGHGACHILAGVYLNEFKNSMYKAKMIVPCEGYIGMHIFVTGGTSAFDFHGYSSYDSLLGHHSRGWSKKYDGWRADIVDVDFALLDTQSLNSRGMRGPDQYLHDPVPRALRFLSKFRHDNHQMTKTSSKCS